MRKRAIGITDPDQAMRDHEETLRQEAIRNLERADLEARARLEAERRRLAAAKIMPVDIEREMARIRATSEEADRLSTTGVIRNTTVTELPQEFADPLKAQAMEDAHRTLIQINSALRDALEFDAKKLGRINVILKAYFNRAR